MIIVFNMIVLGFFNILLFEAQDTSKILNLSSWLEYSLKSTGLEVHGSSIAISLLCRLDKTIFLGFRMLFIKQNDKSE